MPCPLFSRQDNACRLTESVGVVEEERGPAEPELPTDLGVCPGADQRFHRRPAYRSFFVGLFSERA